MTHCRMALNLVPEVYKIFIDQYGAFKMFKYRFLSLYFIISIVLLNNLEAKQNLNDLASGSVTNITVTVTDAGNGNKLQMANVALMREKTVIKGAVTNPAGKANIRDVDEGVYILKVTYIGYEPYIDTISVSSKNPFLEVKMKEQSHGLGEVLITGPQIPKIVSSVDIATGRQVFNGETYHAAPGGQITNLVQQNLTGAVRAPTGEVHIRGQHGEFTYLVDGIPIPLGVFGGLNEIVDPKAISRIQFYTGGFPAEYGGQISALMDIQTRVPSGKFHFDVSTFAGSYLTSGDSLGDNVGAFKALNSNGQSISLSDHFEKFGYFISASRQETDRRIDQPVQELFHNKGTDYFTYGKFDYLLNDNDYLTANLNYSGTNTQVPYDPAEGIMNDEQNTYNAFQTLSYFHKISDDPETESNLFIGAYGREGGLKYIPDANDDNPVYFDNDTVNGYQIEQNRHFATLGVRTKYDKRLSHQFQFATGFNYSYTSGNEDFRFFNSNGDGPKINSDFNGYDFGIFLQSELHPFEWTRFDLGVRYDLHNAPSIGNQDQISPRATLNFLLDEFNTVSVSYSRLFMPTNIENLGAVAQLTGNDAAPTYPEKDNLYEISYTRNWKKGFLTKLAAFYKESSPGLDDETLGSSTIKVNVNIDQVKVTGLELSLMYSSPDIPLSAYINSSLIHAYGNGPVSGGFLPPETDSQPFDLDHDQRLNAVIGVNYQPDNWFMNLNTTYGSGLANGNDNYEFKTGLFDFNTGAHTDPYWIVNLSAGYTIDLGSNHSIEPSVYITNLLDHAHLIKGAFFSGASFEERRNAVFKLSYHY